MKTKEQASKEACNRLRECFKEIMLSPIMKNVDFSDDNNVIEYFRDEWTWYMQGWKDATEKLELTAEDKKC